MDLRIFRHLKPVWLFFFSLTLAFGWSKAQQHDKYLEYADLFVSFLAAEEFEKATEMFDAQVKRSLGVEELRDLWRDLQHAYGVYVDTGEYTIREYKEKVMVYRLMNFNKLPLYLKLVFDENHEIAGIFFEPAQRNDTYQRPPYVDYVRIRERKMNLVSGAYELPAVLTLPKTPGSFPVVILVHGSGPNDMDETIGPNKPFKDLALGLATRGVAVFRYDKRSYVYGAESIDNAVNLDEELVNDAIEAVALVKTFPEVDSGRVFVLGHSLGAMMAPEIGRKSGGTEGIIMMAAPARSLLAILQIQIDHLSERAASDGDTAKMEEIRELKQQVNLARSDKLDLSTDHEKLPFSVPAAYWISVKEHNQVSTAKNLDNRMLVIHAEKDQQVFMEDYELWQRALKDKDKANFRLYKDLNHLFLPFRDPDMSKDYNVQGNVKEEVIEDISTWILKGQLPGN